MSTLTLLWKTKIPPWRIEGDPVIIEFQLTSQEDKDIGDHLAQCGDALCDNIAHPIAVLIEDHADAVTTITSVGGLFWWSKAWLDSLGERDRCGLDEGQLASLAVIRRAWDRNESEEAHRDAEPDTDPNRKD